MIPTYDTIMLPLLRLLSDGQIHSISEAHDKLSVEFELSDEEIRDLLPSGTQPTFRNRLGWAKTYLKKAGLLDSPKRGSFQITTRGKELLSQNLSKIDKSVLEKYPEFNEFQSITNKKVKKQAIDSGKSSELDPKETLELAYQTIKDDLSKEVLSIVKDGSPGFFENLVVDLLIGMGYGGSRKDAGRAVGKSNDGGIDGIIKEDKLGLDTIFIQAKKWEGSVPVKEVRDFTGALASKKAKKGIFIATSYFPKSVYEFVNQVEYKIILIDGERLADLMIEYNVGVSTSQTYHLKSIDSDYFEENL